MSGIYVGDEDCIELEDGSRCYILQDLSQGADDDLVAYNKTQGGDPNPMVRTIWVTKLLELAITRIVPPDRPEYKPTWDQLRLLKASVSARLREEVLARWFPLAWADIQAMQMAEAAMETTSGEPSIGIEALAAARPNGSLE